MPDNSQRILDWLISQSQAVPAAAVDSIMEWKARYDANALQWPEPIDRAISAGMLADRTAYAFLGGFFAAVQHLLPQYAGNRITAFCISEEGGAHPRAIRTRLEKAAPAGNKWLLNGRKQFITCAEYAEAILVAAATGSDSSGRNRIRLVHIERDTPGVRIEPMPDLPFIPEIRHGIVHLEGVVVEENRLLPGDAYSSYIKPFRTVEDIHVSAGILGYLTRCAALYGWPQSVYEDLLGTLVAVRPLAMSDPLSPAVHIALAGVQRCLDGITSGLDPYWEKAPEADRRAWRRDRAVLQIAGKARATRLASAWQAYGNRGIPG